VKGDGGAIGLTENSNQFLLWMVSGPEKARALQEFERVRDKERIKSSCFILQ
jgi:hypothetical protein